MVSTDKSELFAGPINGVFENKPSIVLIVPTGKENAGDQQHVSTSPFKVPDFQANRMK